MKLHVKCVLKTEKSSFDKNSSYKHLIYTSYRVVLDGDTHGCQLESNSMAGGRQHRELTKICRVVQVKWETDSALLRANKSPFLPSYLHHIDPTSYPSPSCPLCGLVEHDTQSLYNCPHIYTARGSLARSMDGGPQGGTGKSLSLGVENNNTSSAISLGDAMINYLNFADDVVIFVQTLCMSWTR